MKRLTLEREQEIREHSQENGDCSALTIDELLSEIDALRAERDNWKADAHTHLDNLCKVIKENDSLKAENEKLIKKVVDFAVDHPCYKLSKELERENQKLREENEKLQKFYDTHVGTLLDENCNQIDLIDQNKKLCSRIAKLREAVQDHADGGNIENYPYLSNKLEAVAADDALSISNNDIKLSKGN